MSRCHKVLIVWHVCLQQKQGLREDTARHYFQQLVVALDYCHSLGIAMRDVKVPILTLTTAATC